MDPDATLADIEWTLREPPQDRDVDLILSLIADLRAWIRKGGFSPNWDKAPLARCLYDLLYTRQFLSPPLHSVRATRPLDQDKE